MPRDSSVYLEDIITAAERIAGYIAGHTRDSFAADPKTVDAVVRNLEIVGEAVKQVPADLSLGYATSSSTPTSTWTWRSCGTSSRTSSRASSSE